MAGSVCGGGRTAGCVQRRASPVPLFSARKAICLRHSTPPYPSRHHPTHSPLLLPQAQFHRNSRWTPWQAEAEQAALMREYQQVQRVK